MNQTLFLYLNSFAGYSLATDQIIFFFAEYAGWVFLGGLIFLLFAHRPNRQLYVRALNVAGSSLLAWLTVVLLKYWLHSDRPFIALADVTQLVFTVKTYAFPSGHTAFFAALGAALFQYWPRLGRLSLALALVIGIARVMAGIHWPLDIVAGFTGGLLMGLILHWFTDRYNPGK